MKTRPLGKSDLEIPPVMLGANVFGWTVGPVDLLPYPRPGAGGRAECDRHRRRLQQVGRGPRRWRIRNDHRQVAGRDGQSRQGRDREPRWAWNWRPIARDCPAGGSNAAVEDSLRRLRTDYIDLYQAHRDDEETPLEETLNALAKLVQAGKVRALGASNYSAARLAQALKISEDAGVPRFESLQPHYNLVERGLFEGDLQQLCLQHGLGVIPYYALAAGFLTGKYRSEQDIGDAARGYRVKNYMNERGLKILSAVDAVAARHGAKPGQVAIAWLAAQPGITAPIASATSLQQLDELVSAANLSLPDDDLATLNASSQPV